MTSAMMASLCSDRPGSSAKPGIETGEATSNQAGLGRLSLARLMRCALLRIAQLRVLQTERAEHTAGSSNDVLDAALLLAAPAAAMCLTVRCATCKGGLGAAHVLAPSSAAMRDAVLRIA